MHAAGVLGHPVEHSISPRLFAFFSKRTGVAIDYRRFDVAPARLRVTLDVLRELGVLAGCNVTIPHKERVAALADTRSAAVDLLGAANVITFRDGSIAADNTDVLGIALTFRRHGIEVRGQDVAVFGAGGAGARGRLRARRTAGPVGDVRQPDGPARAARGASLSGALRRDGVRSGSDRSRRRSIVRECNTPGNGWISRAERPSGARAAWRGRVRPRLPPGRDTVPRRRTPPRAARRGWT